MKCLVKFCFVVIYFAVGFKQLALAESIPEIDLFSITSGSAFPGVSRARMNGDGTKVRISFNGQPAQIAFISLEAQGHLRSQVMDRETRHIFTQVTNSFMTCYYLVDTNSAVNDALSVINRIVGSQSRWFCYQDLDVPPGLTSRPEFHGQILDMFINR